MLLILLLVLAALYHAAPLCSTAQLADCAERIASAILSPVTEAIGPLWDGVQS